MSAHARLGSWVRRREHPAAQLTYDIAKAIRRFELPCVPILHATLYQAYKAIETACSGVLRALWWTPLFKSRISSPASGLYLYGGMPLVLGPLHIHMGRDCRVSGKTTLAGRWHGVAAPTLEVGDNVDIGYQTGIFSGGRIVIGDNVRIASRCLLAGYPGHPLNARDRARGLAETDDQVGDIVLEDDVWLATGVYVMAGVRIGRATIVAAGSVVTRDLPEGVLAGGVPARVIRSLAERDIR